MYTKRSVRIFYNSYTTLNLGLKISKDLRVEDCGEYGSDSFSGIEFKIVGEKSGTAYTRGGGRNGQNFRARLFK